MRHCFLSIVLIFSVSFSIAQMNVFPSNGNVGIGTTNSSAKISFNNLEDHPDNPDRINWYNPNPMAYGIHRTAEG